MSKQITEATRLTVLKHLAAGKNPDVVAALTKLDRYEVIDVGSRHGYPEVAKMAKAVELITKKIERDRLEEVASRPSAMPATRISTVPARPAATVHQPAPSPAPAPVPTPVESTSVNPVAEGVQQPGDIRVLINAGKQSSSKRVQALVERILEQVGRLETLVREEEEKAKAARQAAEEREALRQKKARLEQELAKVNAKLRKPAVAKRPTGTKPALGEGASAKEVRAWAREEGLDVPATGKLPQQIREAYAEAHQDTQAA